MLIAPFWVLFFVKEGRWILLQELVDVVPLRVFVAVDLRFDLRVCKASRIISMTVAVVAC
jgi:hypothetical protein